MCASQKVWTLTKSVKTFESESKVSLRKCLQRYLTFYQRKDSTMIGSSKVQTKMIISTHLITFWRFFLFPTCFDQFGANCRVWTVDTHRPKNNSSLRSNYYFFFLDPNFVYTLKGPARNRTENWEASQNVSWRQQQRIYYWVGLLSFRVRAVS